MNDAAAETETLPAKLDAFEVWENCLARFRAACQSARPPRVDELPGFVQSMPAAYRQDVLVDLAHLHLQRSWEVGQRVKLEDYVAAYGARFAEFASLAAVPAELVEQELVARHVHPSFSDHPRFEEYEERFAGRKDVLERLDARYLNERRYVKIRLEGQGGLGLVWMGYDHHLERYVAIKEPQPEIAADVKVLRRLDREARITAGLEHPAIVTVHEHHRTNGNPPFYVMQLVRGRTFQKAILEHHSRKSAKDASERHVEWNQLLRTFTTVCDAVAYAHAQGVLHRDLKPQNVILGEHGETVVLDWGLACRFAERESERLVLGRDALSDVGTIRGLAESTPVSGVTADWTPQKQQSGSLTEAGQVVGTPAYVSPEQAEGHSERVGSATDVYSLGAMLYELLVGKPPYVGSGMEVLRQVWHGPPPPPSQVRSATPAALEAVCLKAMARQPEQRYASAGALARDVEHWLADEPVEACPEPAWARLKRWARKHQALVSTGIAAVLLLIAGLVVVLGVTAAANRDLAASNDQMRIARDAEAEAKQLAERRRNQVQNLFVRESEARREAQRRLSEVYVEKGRSLCERGDVALGMNWFSRSLETLPDRSPHLEQAIRLNLSLWRGSMLSLRGCFPHRSGVTVVAFSSDSKLVLTASFDRRARLWHAETGEPAGPWLAHPHQVEAAVLALDNETVVTGCYDGNVRVFNGKSGELIGEPINTGALVRQVVLGTDGRLGAARNNSGKLVLFDAKAGVLLQEQIDPTGSISSVAFSPDGKRILTGSHKPAAAQLWDVAARKAIGKPLPHEKGVSKVAFSPDGKTFCTVSDYVRLWSTIDGTPAGPTIRHGGVADVAFRFDGKVMATASYGGQCALWRIPDGKLVVPPLQHHGQVPHVVFSPDGRTLLTSSSRIARLWDAASGKPLAQPLRDAGKIAISPDGKMIATGSYEKTARLWTVSAAAPPVRLLKHEGLIRDAAFSPKGDHVVLGVQNGVARIWSTATGEQVGKTMTHQKTVAAVAFHPDGQTVAVASWDGLVRLYNTATGQPIGRKMEHEAAVRFLAFTRAGDRLLSAGDDKKIRIWAAASGAPIGPMIQNPTQLRAMAVSPDGTTVLAGNWNGTAYLWDANSARQLHRFVHQGASGVDAVAFSPDGATLLTADNKGLVRLWSAATGVQRGAELKHERGVSEAVFSADGESVLTVSFDQTARLWRTADGRLIGKTMRHEDAVVSADLSRDGTVVLTGGEDNTAVLWQAQTGIRVGPKIDHRGEVSVAAFSPSSSAFLTGSGTARISDLTSMTGTKEQIALWMTVTTGIELKPDGAVSILEADAWSKRRRRHAEQGGMPPSITWPLWRLINPKVDGTGPYGRSYLSTGR